MDTTGKTLVEHWSWAAKKGLMNKNTAGAMRAACSQVLGVLDNWQTADVTELDVDDVLKRFKTLRYADFKPESLETYDQRFRQALRSYLAYVQDPGKWRFSTRDRAVAVSKSGTARKAKKTPESASETEMNGDDGARRLGVRAITTRDSDGLDGGRNTYPFPLRAGFTAQLVLPPDLKASEVKRLSTFMSTLVADETSST